MFERDKSQPMARFERDCGTPPKHDTRPPTTGPPSLPKRIFLTVDRPFPKLTERFFESWRARFPGLFRWRPSVSEIIMLSCFIVQGIAAMGIEGRRRRRRAVNWRASDWRAVGRSRIRTLESLEARNLLAGDPLAAGSPVLISEFVADNDTTFLTRLRSSTLDPFDGPAQAFDWIELFNPTTQPVDLTGMHLTDDPEDPNKWGFPAGTRLDAGAFTMVFASGRDVTEPALDERGYLHTNFALNDRGEYLALTAANGTVLHEFAPAFPAQRVDVSYAVPMTPKAIVDESTQRKYEVPSSPAQSDQWYRPTFDDSPFTAAASGALGFDRGGGIAEPGITIGPEPTERSSVDFSRGSIVVLETAPFTEAGRVAEWSFYSTKTIPITPLIFRASGEEFVITGIGRTRTSDGSGQQTFAFELQTGSDLVDPGQHYFGFKDGDNETDVAGVVVYERSDLDQVRRYSGPSIGKLVPEQPLTGGRDFGRSYSVQATTQARLDGPFATDLSQAMDQASSVYVRYTFSADELPSLRNLTLDVRYEDGFIAYLNGVEVARRNYVGAAVFDGVAAGNRGLADANRFESINISAFRGLLRENDNVLALHAFNDARDDGEFLIDARLHGVSIATADPATYAFAAQPSPADANGSLLQGFSQTPQASHSRGLYDQPFLLTLATPASPLATIYYTTDGSVPGPDNPASSVYSAPIAIDRTTTIRTISRRDGYLDSTSIAYTYIFPQDVADQEGMHPVVAQDPTWRPQLIEGLRTIPTISLVTDGRISEAPEIGTSVEMIFPDGQRALQVNAGIEIFGGTAIAFPKRSMRISFKNQYGPSMLDYDVFDDPAGVNQFDQLLLRAGSHDTPFFAGSSGAGAYIRNRWANDRQLEMGQPAPRGRFVHVYVNGAYSGQYQLMERPNAAFMANQFGGSKDDYDAINAGRIVDGDLQAWNELLDVIDDGYDRVAQYLDVVNYADYVLLQFFGGNNIDWRPDANWMAARRREPGEGFVFFAWDSDIILRSGRNTDITYFGGPGFLWTAGGGVRQYAEFREILAERAQKWFFDDGMFTPQALRNQLDELAAQIRLSVIAETARWGSGIYTPATFEAAITWMKDTYAPLEGPTRAEIVVEQLRQSGALPRAATPTAVQDGTVATGAALRPGAAVELRAPEGTIYYTLDGTDPRAVEPLRTTRPLVGPAAAARIHVPTDASLGRDWILPSFDDSTWLAGVNGVGYDTTGELAPHISVDVQATMFEQNSSAYLRIPFELDDVDAIDTLELAVQYDDGFIAYLNGVEIARRNAGGASFNARSTAPHPNIEAIAYEPFNVTPYRSLLVPGRNVLAIHGMNIEPTNVDFLIRPTLTASTVTSAGVATSALAYQTPLPVSARTRILARTYLDGQWSALRELSVPAPPLRISEIMYHPADPSASEITAGFEDADEFEFIELTNASNQPLDLSSVRLIQVVDGDTTRGVAFDFAQSPIQELAPGAQVLVVENLDAFAARYGDGLPVAGQWQGRLSNSTETITLVAGNLPVQSVTYVDDWYAETDGEGASLEIRAVTSSDLDLWNQGAGWMPSLSVGGTPGRHGAEPIVGDSNGDGRFDSSDLVAVFIAGEYEDNLPGNSTFAEGDWNGDGDFTTADLVYAFEVGGYQFAAQPGVPPRRPWADGWRDKLLAGLAATVADDDWLDVLSSDQGRRL